MTDRIETPGNGNFESQKIQSTRFFKTTQSYGEKWCFRSGTIYHLAFGAAIVFRGVVWKKFV